MLDFKIGTKSYIKHEEMRDNAGGNLIQNNYKRESFETQMAKKHPKQRNQVRENEGNEKRTSQNMLSKCPFLSLMVKF